MYRALPISNRILDQKQKEKNKLIHRQHLISIKPSIDSSSPRIFRHLLHKSKKEKMRQDRHLQIQRTNQILLDRMTGIGNHKIRPLQPQNQQKRSLNQGVRRRQLIKISKQNQQFLKRLKQKRASYNIRSWEKDRENHQRRLKSICLFPYQFSVTDKKRPVSQQRGTRTENSRRSTTKSRNKNSSVLESQVVFKKGVTIQNTFFIVEIRKLSSKVVLTALDLEKNGNYTLEIPLEDVEKLIAGDTYARLAGLLEFENGELVLVDPHLEEES